MATRPLVILPVQMPRVLMVQRMAQTLMAETVQLILPVLIPRALMDRQLKMKRVVVVA